MQKLYQFDLTYDRDLKKNYMVLKTDLSSFNEEDYQVQMLQNNKIDHVLAMDLRCHNETISLYYDITSTQPLSELLGKKEITYVQVKRLFERFMTTVTNSHQFLLSEDQFIFDKDFIFIEPSTWIPHFCYVPEIKNPKSLVEQMKELVDFLITRVAEEDKEAILLVHQLYTRLRERYVTFNELKTLLDEDKMGSLEQGRQSEPRTTFEAFKDEEAQPLRSPEVVKKKPIKEQPQRNRMSKMPIKSEKVIEEKEIQVMPLKNKIFAGLIQMVVIGLGFAVIHLGIFVNEVTAQTDMGKLVAFIAILIALDIYGLMKLLHPSNKAVKIVEVEKTMPIQPRSSYGFMNMDKTSIQSNGSEEESPYHYPSQDLKLDREEAYEEEEETYEGTTLLTEEEVGTTLLTDDPEQGLQAYLLIDKEGAKERINLHATPFIIGKMQGQVDYKVDNATVSRLHAKIVKVEGGLALVDLNSRNGTFVNGIQIPSQVPKELKNEDEIKVSNVVFTFYEKG